MTPINSTKIPPHIDREQVRDFYRSATITGVALTAIGLAVASPSLLLFGAFSTYLFYNMTQVATNLIEAEQKPITTAAQTIWTSYTNSLLGKGPVAPDRIILSKNTIYFDWAVDLSIDLGERLKSLQ